VIVLEWVVTASHTDSTGSHTVGTAGRGSILGELSILTSGVRQATVTAATSVRAALGGAHAFEELLGMQGLRQRLIDIAAQHFASVADPVPVTLADGTRLLLRPLLRTDRDRLASAFARQSGESIRRRFFTAARPSPQIIDYLVNIDYIDHFAWGAATEDGGHAVAEGRYVRLLDDPEAAEVAFDVVDKYQRRGMATLLLGALAVAAASAGISRFVASVLYENAPMRAVLEKASASWRHEEPGVVSCWVEVSAAARAIEDPPRSELRRTAERVVTAAGLDLHARAG
jgi:RimJ/RimL family protein N-acetyltransferase